MSRKTIPITKEKLDKLCDTSSDILQKTTEAVGTLKILDIYLSEIESTKSDNDVLWALRNAIRNIESATADAVNSIDTIEQFEEIAQ